MIAAPISLRLLFLLLIPALWLAHDPLRAEPQAAVPRIDGDWWQVAANPDLGEWTSEKQQPVDFQQHLYELHSSSIYQHSLTIKGAELTHPHK